jgi:hypothetical protein
MEGSAPSEMKEETSKAQTFEKKDDSVHLDCFTPYQGTTQDKQP